MQSQTVGANISTPVTRSWFQWGKTTLEKLAEVETRIFAAAGVSLVSRFIPIGFKNGEIYTITHNAETKKADEPIVLIHGFGAGVGIWSRCIQRLATNHVVHAFDLLGFGRSSRPSFHKDPEIAEMEMVSAIEDWRRSMDIEKMHLVAHSFGGYLASLYALEHPERVKHLILVDPWGFGDEHPSSVKEIFPGTFRSAIISFGLMFNPFAVLRLTGSYAPSLIKKARPDLMRRYPSENEDDIYNYIYYCNSQSPTGEAAFKRMSHLLGWAKRPIYTRFREMDSSVPVTFLLGEHSWIDSSPAYNLYVEKKSHVDLKVIRKVGHHVYADNPEVFSDAVREIADKYWKNVEG